MRTALIGCGAMGSVYVGRLAEARADVLAIGRSEPHMRAIAEHGLRLTGPDGERIIRVRATTEVPDEPVDLVIIAVKAADAAAAAQRALLLVGEGTVVLTIQNGLGSAEEVAAVVGADRLAVGVASGFGASLPSPGHVHHNAMRALRFGSYGDLPRAELDGVVELWRSAGFDVEAVTDIAVIQWEKLICNVAYSGLAALTGMTVGEVMDDPDLGPVSRAAAVEAWRCARALGVDLKVTDPEELVRDFAAAMPAAKPSVLLDLEAGRPSEIGVINGAVPREGAKVGFDAPVNATITGLVRQRERARARE